jgi:hypothetical protein
MIAEGAAHRAHPGGERWGPPHSLPLQCRASTALVGWGHVPSPVPPQRAEVTGGAAHVPPPLRWSQVSIDGIAAAQPAASAKSGVEKCDPSPPGPGSEVNGPRAGRRAGARRRRRGAARCGPRAGQCPGGGAARKRSGVKEATATVVEEGGAGEASRAHGAEERSGEARAACRGDPRRRRRAPAERSVDGPARGPAREDQIRHEERS